MKRRTHMASKFRLVLPVLAACQLVASAPHTFAHPHVFAEARLDVVVSGDRTVDKLQHLWRFDDVFSSTVLLEFDANQDLKLDETELAEVSNVVYDSLSEYNYFQIVTADGKDVAMTPPEKLVADFVDNQLIILFEAHPAAALPLAGTVGFGIYDPTFYTAIEFIGDETMAVDNLPDGCSRAVIRPDPDEAIAQNQSTLTDAFFDDPQGTDYSKIFATRLELKCPANG